MRLNLALKTLFRAPIKTLITFILLVASSFMFIYNVADYSLVTREFEKAIADIRGIGTVEHEPPLDVPAPQYMNSFLMSDKDSTVNSGRDEIADIEVLPHLTPYYNQYDINHQRSITQSELEALSSLPYVSVSKRYMTAGISDEYYRLEEGDSFFNYAARFVIEAEYIYEDKGRNVPGLQPSRNIYLKNVNWLGGNPDWRYNSELDDEGKVIRVLVDTFELDINRYYDFTYHAAGPKAITYYRYNRAYQADIDKMVTGQRYLIIGRAETYGYFLDPRESKGFNASYNIFYAGDDTLFGWWDYYIYPLDGLPGNYLELDGFAPVRELIEITNADLHTFDVVYTDDMLSIPRFDSGDMTITEGRMLTKEDYENGRNVCVVSTDFKLYNHVELGDTIKLKLGDKLFEQYAPLGAVASARERYADEFTDTEFEIVGFYKNTDTKKIMDNDLYWRYSINTVFVPMSFLPVSQEVLDTHEFKPGEITIIVSEAGNIPAFLEETVPKIEDLAYILNFSDNGWLEIEKRVEWTEGLLLVKLIAFTLTVIIAIVLTVYLFIVRKRREYAIMRALGTTKHISNRALYIPLGFVAFIAIAFGSVSAVVYAVRNASQSLRAVADAGFSIDTSSLNTALPVQPVLIGILAEIALLLFVTFYGLSRVARQSPLELIQEGVNRNGTFVKRVAKSKPGFSRTKSSVYSGTPLQAEIKIPRLQPISETKRGYNAARHVLHYVLSHSKRAMAKSILSVALATLLIGSIGQFSATRYNYSELYQSIKSKATVTGTFPYSRAMKFVESGYVSDYNFEYQFRGIGEGANRRGGAECNERAINFCFTANLRRLRATPVEFLEGFDESVMKSEGRYCILDSRVMEELGIELGDEVRICEYQLINTMRRSLRNDTEEELMEKYNRRSVFCTVVGRFTNDTYKEMVFVPASNEFISITGAIKFEVADFILADNSKADEFRQFAKEVLEFENLYNGKAPFIPLFALDTSEADSVLEAKKLLDSLYPVAVAAAVLIGGLLPGLIVIQSSKEASILRVLGTTKKRTRLMLILEQLVLCLIGLAAAMLIIFAINSSVFTSFISSLVLYCVFHFIGCTVGCAICAIVVTKRNVLELLQVKE